MDALVGTEDLRQWLGLPSIDTGRAELLLELASDLVRAELGQVLSFVEDDEVDLIARGAKVLLLPELPVWSVALVSEKPANDSELTALAQLDDYALELGPDGRTGILRRLNGTWRAGYTYRVKNTHGYATPGATGESADELPGAIKAVILRTAGRAFTNPTGLRQRTMGRYSETDGATVPGMYLTAADKHDLDPFYPGDRAGAR